MSHLSAHADYRHEDYFFARSQSRAMAARDWEKSEAAFLVGICLSGTGRCCRAAGMSRCALSHAKRQHVLHRFGVVLIQRQESRPILSWYPAARTARSRLAWLTSPVPG